MLEKLFLKSLDLIEDGVVISDPSLKDNPLIYVNKGFVSLTGYSKEEVIGKNCRFLQGKDTTQKELNRLRKAIEQKKPVRVVLKNYKKDGTLFYNELSLSPIIHEQKFYFIGIQHDVTQRINNEHKIMQYKHELEALVEKRTWELLEKNQRLRAEIESRKKWEEQISRIQVHASLKPQITLHQKEWDVVHASNTKKSTLSTSTYYAIKRRLIQKGILTKAYIPSFGLFPICTIIIGGSKKGSISFRGPTNIDIFFTSLDNIKRLDGDKTYLVARDTRFFGHSNTHYKRLSENEYRVLYGHLKYPTSSLSYMSKMIQVSVPTISRIRNKLSHMLYEIYYPDPKIYAMLSLGTYNLNAVFENELNICFLANLTQLPHEDNLVFPTNNMSLSIDFAPALKQLAP